MTKPAARLPAAPRRSPAAQHVLTVQSSQWLGPHLVRVVAGGASLAEFADNGYTDAYVKLLFADPALGLEPPYDLAALRETLRPDQLPAMRTYTVRWVDRDACRLAIDFVVHGDSGIAAPWAARTVPGDRLVFSGPGGAYAPDPTAAWHHFIGDLSALPAIAAAVQTLPAEARGIVQLEIESSADIIDLDHPGGVQIDWMVNPDPSDANFLANALDRVGWPRAVGANDVHVFAHGERESIKAVRAVLARHGIPRERISISGYWARGRTEDVFQAEKRQPIGQID